MNKAEKALVSRLSKVQNWTPVPYSGNEREIDSLAAKGEIIYDPRCQAAMLPGPWETASERVKRNADGWEALQRAENPEAHIYSPEGPPGPQNAEKGS